MAKTEGELPDSCFAYVPSDGPPSDRKLRLCDVGTGELDAGIVGAAAAALGPGYRGQKVQLPSGSVAGAKAKVRAAWKTLHPDAAPADMPAGIALSDPAPLTDAPSTAIVNDQRGPSAPFLTHLHAAVKKHLAEHGTMSADDFDALVKSAAGHAGGKAAASKAMTALSMMDGPLDPKLSKLDVHYRLANGDDPDGDGDTDDACANCRFYQVGQCQLVEGTIEAPFICDEYQPPVQAFPDPSDDDEAAGMVSMTEATGELPPTAPLDARAIRPLLFSIDQEWIPFLPTPGKYAHSVYGDLNLEPAKYARLIANFNANVYKQDLPINVEHDSRAAGAVGWIKPGGMRLASDGSIEVKPEWNETGRALLDGDRFRYVSAEFCDRWQDPVTRQWHSDVAVGLAICTRPHFKTDVLQPLAASEGAALALAHSLITAGDAGKGTPMANEPQTQDAPTTPEAAAPPAPVILNDLSQIVLSAEQRALERRQFAELREGKELAERERDTYKAKFQAQEKERRAERFLSEVLGRSAENGLRWIGDAKEHVEFLTSLAEQFGDESPQVRRVIESERQKRQAIEASGVFRTLSAVSASIDGGLDEASRLAHEYQLADPKLTKEQATTKVFTEHPELYTRYLESRR